MPKKIKEITPKERDRRYKAALYYRHVNDDKREAKDTDTDTDIRITEGIEAENKVEAQPEAQVEARKGVDNITPPSQIGEGVNKVYDVAKDCQTVAPEIIQALIDISRNPGRHARAKLSAIKELLDRGYGKPRETIDTGVTVVWDIKSGKEG